jgi:hypothetical protein
LEANVNITTSSLRIVEIGKTFRAHLGDGVDGLPDPREPDLPEAYGFELAPVLVDCPECAGNGAIFVRATAAMWAGLIPWPGDQRGETCGFCEGAGQVTLEEYRWYEQAIAESFAE